MDAALLVLLGLQALVACGFVVVSATAWRGHRLSGAQPLRRFALAYLLLAGGQVVAATLALLTSTAQSIRLDGFGVLDSLFLLHYGLQLGGWTLVLTTFERPKLRWVLASGPFLLVAGPVLQLAVIVVLFLVVLHGGLNHIERKRAGSLRTALGYGFLLGAQFAFLFGYTPLTPHSLLGEALALVGVALLAVTARLRSA